MTAAFARAVMALAVRCLRADCYEWGLAMEAEFEAAAEDGKPLLFATGCLIAGWREMVNHDEGRLVLAKYALALGLLLPIAGLQFERVIGVSSVFYGQESLLRCASPPGPAPASVDRLPTSNSAAEIP